MDKKRRALFFRNRARQDINYNATFQICNSNLSAISDDFNRNKSKSTLILFYLKYQLQGSVAVFTRIPPDILLFLPQSLIRIFG